MPRFWANATASATEWSVEAVKEGVRITGGSKLAATRAVEEFLRVCTFGAGNTLAVPVDLSLSGKEADRLDNSSFLSYLPSGSAALIDSNGKGNLMTPEWAESLVMTEVRILTASKGKRLQHAVKLFAPRIVIPASGNSEPFRGFTFMP